jgi:hypothetical protein
MQIRIPIAALLLSILEQRRRPLPTSSLPQPFAQQKGSSHGRKRCVSSNLQSRPLLRRHRHVEPAVCSIPLMTVEPPVNAPKMPILYLLKMRASSSR